MALLKKICRDLANLVDPNNAKNLQRFFKTRKGEYGYGDKFLGISVPNLRNLAKAYCPVVTFNELGFLLASKLHEKRLLALLVLQYNKSDLLQQKQIYDFYFANSKGINNWDLVDLSAPYIVGAYLLDKEKEFLHKLAAAKNLWQRRIAIVATLYFIRHGSCQETLRLTKKLLCDEEDLIHKAVGWALREVGKRDLNLLQDFLAKYYRLMPRTMLRYAIERLAPELRLAYLHGKI